MPLYIWATEGQFSCIFSLKEEREDKTKHDSAFRKETLTLMRSHEEASFPRETQSSSVVSLTFHCQFEKEKLSKEVYLFHSLVHKSTYIIIINQ